MNLSKQLRAVRVYSFTSCLRLTDAVWVVLLAARGFTLAQIGLAEAVFHLTSLLCEVPSGVAADLLGRRRSLAVSAVLEICSDLTMAFSRNFAAVCAAMALKALAYTMISGTLEALTYDSLKTAGRESEYLQIDASVSVLQRLATALGSLASVLSGVLRFAGFYLANAGICFCSLLAALALQEPLVTDEQTARQRRPFADLAARLRAHVTESAAVLRTTPLAVRLIAADAAITLPSYLTTMFVQQRLVTLGWDAAWLFVSPLLASAAAMAGTALARRLHPGKLRPLYRLCALVCGGGVLLAGAGPAWGCLAGPMLVQAAISVWCLHAMQRFNDAIPSDRRATLISVDSMAYSVLMIPASPLLGLLADLTGHAGAGLCALGGLVLASGLLLPYRK